MTDPNQSAADEHGHYDEHGTRQVWGGLCRRRTGALSKPKPKSKSTGLVAAGLPAVPPAALSFFVGGNSAVALAVLGRLLSEMVPSAMLGRPHPA